MDKNTVFVTSYNNPDLDGVACSIVYSELLKTKGIQAVPLLFGRPHREALFVLKEFNIPKPVNAKFRLKNNNKIILVDASDLRGIAGLINSNEVIEIIDHRKENQAEKFPYAKKQIELVGSCATLIAEKFFAYNIIPARSSRVLLYSAIVSNTVNFKATVTTERDINMAKWLLERIKLPENYIMTMFEVKSVIKGSLKKILGSDLAIFDLNTKKLGIAQLEIVKAEDFISEKKSYVISALKKIKLERKLDYIFLSLVDIVKGNNIFVSADNQSAELITKTLKTKFQNGIATRKGVLMRKTIAPRIRESLHLQTIYHN